MNKAFLQFRKNCWLTADALCIALLLLCIYHHAPLVGVLTCLMFVVCVIGISLFTLITPLRVWNEGHITGENSMRA